MMHLRNCGCLYLSCNMLRSCCQLTTGSMGFDRLDTTWDASDLTFIRHCCCAGSTERTLTAATDHPSLAECVLIVCLDHLVSPLGVCPISPIICPQHVLGGGVVRCQPCSCALWVLGSTQLALRARAACCMMLGRHPT